MKILEPERIFHEPLSSLEIRFKFQFTRKEYYFMHNIFIPLLLLVILQMASFCFPVDSPDRAMYNVTLLLSMFVLKSETMSYLPKTPRPIHISSYLLAKLIFSTVLTIYSALICLLSMQNPNLNKLFWNFSLKRSISLIGLVDLIAFSLSFLTLLTVNVGTAAIVINVL